MFCRSRIAEMDATRAFLVVCLSPREPSTRQATLQVRQGRRRCCADCVPPRRVDKGLCPRSFHATAIETPILCVANVYCCVFRQDTPSGHVVQLVKSEGLDDARSKLCKVTCVHVYSVQPSMPKVCVLECAASVCAHFLRASRWGVSPDAV